MRHTALEKDESLLEEDEKYVAYEDSSHIEFWTENRKQWTFMDQKRLVSIEHLFLRTMEFHNNDHSFRTTLGGQSILNVYAPCFNETVIETTFITTNGGIPRPTRVNMEDLQQFLDATSIPDNGLLWLQVKELCSLDKLSKRFGISSICSAGFLDMRAHTNVVVTYDGSAMLLTICTMYMELESAHMYKVYIYATRGLLISYERELMEDPDTVDKDKTACRDLVFEAVLRRMDLILPGCLEFGSLYLLYEIVLDSLFLSDSVLEFFSRSTSYLKPRVHKGLSYEDKLTILTKMHILHNSIMMLSKLLDRSTSVLHKFSDRNAAIFAVLNGNLLCPRFVPYWLEISDSYEFMQSCLQREESQLEAITQAMDAVTSVRANQTAMNLSLIATVFLPVTFLSGVFGMNFEKGGSYTDPLLNSPRGPLYFWLMCLVVLLLNVLYFIGNGWMTIRIDSLLSSRHNDLAAALSEERRRSMESAVVRRRRRRGAPVPATDIRDTSGGGVGIGGFSGV